MLDAALAVVGKSSSLRLADINDRLPITDLHGSIDVAQAVGVLEFAKDLPSIFSQVYDSLRGDGVFVFTLELKDEVHNSDSEAYTGYEHGGEPVPYGVFLANKQT